MKHATYEEFEVHRELERITVCPPLEPEEIQLITKTVFIEPNPQKADLLFVFGSACGDKWEQVARLQTQGFAQKVYIGGGKGKGGRILSHVIREEFIRLGVNKDLILVDENSHSTLEDAVYGKKLFLENNVTHKRILFACKAFHGGRCLRTLHKIFPDANLFPFLYDFIYEGKTITPGLAKVWWHDETARSYVYGEYLRILLYSSRGDITKDLP